MKYIFVVIFAILFSGLGAQTSDKSQMLSKNNPKYIYYDGLFKKAEKLYRQFAYTNASKLFEELRNADFKKTQSTKRLVECFRLTQKWDKAEPLYAELVQNDSIDAVYYYYYAQSLRSNGKYGESLNWMEKFNTKNQSDSRGQKFVEEKNFIETIRSKEKSFEVSSFNDINSPQSDFGAYLMNGELIFASARAAGLAIKDRYSWDEKPFLDLYTSTYKNDTVSQITILPANINTKLHEGPATITKDNNTMYFTRNNIVKRKKINSQDGTTQLQMFKTQKKNNKWSDPVKLPFNNDEFSVGHPALSPDAKRLYFSSNMPGGFGGTDLYYVEITSDTSYSAPVNLGKSINTEGNEMFPFITESGYLIFASDGLVGFGGLDLFSCSPKNDGNYDKPQNLGEPLNSSNDDFAFYIDKEEKNGFFSSNRTGGKGDDDIYKVKLLKPFKRKVVATLIAVNKTDSAKLSNTNIKLYEGDKLIAEQKTDENGETKITVEPDKNYKIVAERDSFKTGESTFTTQNLTKDEVACTAALETMAAYNLIGYLSDKKTGEKIPGVKITFIDKATNAELFSIVTSDAGDFRKKLENAKSGDKIEYKLKIEKEGYLAKNAEYGTTLSNPGDYSVSDVLKTVEMEKIELGLDLGKMLNLNPIYFDYAKDNIRKDAAVELDKIVKAMKENPTMVIELGSHTDCRGPAKSNEQLSDRRAKSSAAYIVSKGIDATRISGKGYGETKPINKCECEGTRNVPCTEAEHQLNRRTEFIIVKM